MNTCLGVDAESRPLKVLIYTLRTHPNPNSNPNTYPNPEPNSNPNGVCRV